MKIYLSILILSLISNFAWAKTAEQCKAEISSTRVVLSDEARSTIMDILKTDLSPAQKKSLTAKVLRLETCVIVILQNGQSSNVEGLASSLVDNVMALPADMQTEETIDGLIGYMLFES